MRTGSSTNISASASSPPRPVTRSRPRMRSIRPGISTSPTAAIIGSVSAPTSSGARSITSRPQGAEQQLFFEQYAQTLKSYERVFGESAPADLWPPAARRLIDDPKARRVHPRDGFLVTRRQRARPCSSCRLCSSLPSGRRTKNMSLGPFDLTGGPFLILYIVLLVATVIAGFVIPRRLRPQGRDATGHRRRPARLPRRRALPLQRRARRPAAGDAGADHGTQERFRILSRELGPRPPKRSVLALPSPIALAEIERALKPYGEPVERRADRGRPADDDENAPISASARSSPI